MQIFANLKQSFSDFHVALVGVVRDAWLHSRRTLCVVTLLAIIIGLVPYAVKGVEALLINYLVKVFNQKSFDATLITLTVFLLAAYMVRFVSSSTYEMYRKLFWMDRQQRYDFQFSTKLAKLDVATHESPDFQDEITLLKEQGISFTVANFLDSIVMNLQNVAGMFAASVIVIAVDWRFFVIMFIANFPKFYGEVRYGNGMWSIHQSQSPDRRMYDEMHEHTSTVVGIRELQTFQTAPFFLRRQWELLTRFLEAEKGQERKRFRFNLFSEVLAIAGLLFVITLLLVRVVNGDLQVGTFLFILTSIVGLEGTLGSFLISFADQQTKARLVAAFYAIMKRTPVIKIKAEARTLTLVRAPEIEFRNVSFAYPNNPTQPVLKNLSLTIGSGERLGLVGINGAGKSTMINLLVRFYDPTEGAVLIDGVDLRDIDLESWYAHLALLSQDYVNYHLKTWELIGLGRYSEECRQYHVEEAAKKSQADPFIRAWRDGYNQQLGKEFAGGANPSGGQWQRLALSRTFYCDPFLTVLDEPTAHVDAEAEAKIFDLLLSQLSPVQTLIITSHRFSTIRKANRICVLKDGSIAELGSHLELVRQGGIYAGLFDKQAEGYR